MHLMGIDIGSSAVKAAVFDEKMRLVRVYERAYAAKNLGEGLCETPVEQVWSIVCDVICQACAGLEVGAISAASFGEAAVPVDKAGRVLHDNILYTDLRGQAAFESIIKKVSQNYIYQITGAQPHPMYSLYKMAWFKENCPEIIANTARFHQMADFVLTRLGANPHMDYTLCARTQAFDVVNKKWADEIIQAADIDAALFPQAVAPGEAVGWVSNELADRLGLKRGCVLAAGGHDQPCMALGNGAVRPGMASDGMGTVECIVPVADHPPINEKMRAANFACAPHVLAGRYVTFAFNQCAGALLEWYRRLFAHSDQSVGELLKDMADDAQGLMMTPYFTGAATPYMDPAARGALVGLTLGHDQRHILRALAEGITYEMMLNLKCLRRAGFTIDRLTAAGGLTRSERLMQLKADMMGLPIDVVGMEHAGCKGAALLAGQAAGLFDAETMAAETAGITRTYWPNRENNARYVQCFKYYCDLYGKTNPVT